MSMENFRGNEMPSMKQIFKKAALSKWRFAINKVDEQKII